MTHAHRGMSNPSCALGKLINGLRQARLTLKEEERVGQRPRSKRLQAPPSLWQIAVTRRDPEMTPSGRCQRKTQWWWMKVFVFTEQLGFWGGRWLGTSLSDAEMKHQVLFWSVCDTCFHVWVHICGERHTCTHIYRPGVGTRCLLNTPFYLSSVSLTETKVLLPIAQLASLFHGPVSLLPSVAVTDGLHTQWTFMWVLSISTAILTLVHRVPRPRTVSLILVLML